MALTEALLERDNQKEIQIKRTIALNLLSENLPLEVVARTTGLSIEQVQQLQTQSTQN
jgi:predicted transposase YdaD